MFLGPFHLKAEATHDVFAVLPPETSHICIQ